VVIDDKSEVIRNYRQYLSGKGQPGLGDAFLKYICDNEYDATKVIRVRLDKEDDGSYAVFPKDSRLSAFDPADRIFVALVLACPQTTTILNAVDSDYSHHADALNRHGVQVEELCPGLLKPQERRER